jgi:ankyrin repeat protein
VQVEARRVEVRKEVALETALSTEEVEELRTSTEAAWLSEQDAERLQAKVVLARAQRMLQRARATRDKAELLKVGLAAVSTADKDTLCAIAVKAAAQEGVDMNTRAEAAAGEEPKESWLRDAANKGSVETVRALLEAGAEVDNANDLGRTALDGAACRGQVEVIQALLAAGAVVDHADKTGETALFGAASNGEVDAVRALLAAGAAVDRVNTKRRTALDGAACSGHVEVIQALLAAGAVVDHADKQGITALSGAANFGQVDAVRALLAAGAAVNHVDKNTATALWAARSGKERELQQAKNINRPGNCIVYIINDNGRTPLAATPAGNHEATVRALVEAGATE